jgi:hypothetical protein
MRLNSIRPDAVIPSAEANFDLSGADYHEKFPSASVKYQEFVAVEKPFFKEIFSINLLSPSGRGQR